MHSQQANGSVAQLNRVLDYGSSGYRFESCRSHEFSRGYDRIVTSFFIGYGRIASLRRPLPASVPFPPPACGTGPPRRGGGAPLRSGPAPRFWPRGGAILFSLRRVWGLRRLRAALKVYRAARAAQCKCGVHGFAMNPCVLLHVATAPYYREARVTIAWRQTACRMRHCCARRIE